MFTENGRLLFLVLFGQAPGEVVLAEVPLVGVAGLGGVEGAAEGEGLRLGGQGRGHRGAQKQKEQAGKSIWTLSSS